MNGIQQQNADCGCPEKLLKDKNTEANFRGLDCNESYFPMVSRADSYAFFGASLASVKPQQTGPWRRLVEAPRSSNLIKPPVASSKQKHPKFKSNCLSREKAAQLIPVANKLSSALNNREEEQMRGMWEIVIAPYREKIEVQTAQIVEKDAEVKKLKSDIESKNNLSLGHIERSRRLRLI